MFSQKIINFSEIKTKLLKKIKKKKVVLCHGVFDLLHIGHLNHFEESKRFGDTLVVSITKDEFVNKGPNRPVFSTSQRAKMISSLDCVDYVIINDTSTAENVIKILKPKIYSKGIDYLDQKMDFTFNIKKEIRAIKDVKGRIKFTKSHKIDSSKILDSFDLIFNNEQKKFLKKIKNNLNLTILESCLKKIKSLKVLVIGETIIDHYVLCGTLGKSGKEAFLTFKKNNELKFLGGSGFVANQVSNFVDKIDILTILGKSNKDNNFIKKKLNKNIKIKPFIKQNLPTIVKSRYIDDIDLKKIIGIYDLDDQIIKQPIENKINNYLKKNINNYDLVIVTDFGHGMITEKIAKTICSSKGFLSVNAQVNSSNSGVRNLTKYKKVDCVVINSNELVHETGKKMPNVEALAKILKRKIGIDNLVITRGSSGALLINKNEKIISVPAFAKNKTDKIGAGDALLGVFSLFKAKNIDDRISLLISSLVSGYTVEKFGNDNPITKSYLAKILSHII